MKKMKSLSCGNGRNSFVQRTKMEVMLVFFGNGFSHTIMRYLCDKHQSKLYDNDDIRRRALIDDVMDWQNS